VSRSNGHAFGGRTIAAALAYLLAACGGQGIGPARIGPPVNLSVSAGRHQTGAVGELLAAPLAAKVTDAAGRAVPNIPVEFIVAAGAGDIVTVSPRSDGAGIATTQWRVGTVAGLQRVIARVVDTLTGAPIDTVSFTAFVTAGPPASLTQVSGGYQSGWVGMGLSETLRVRVRDAHGNPALGVGVSWAVAVGSATVNSRTFTDHDGVAPAWVILGQTEGQVEVHALVGALPPVSFYAWARRTTQRLTTFPGSAFGIARTPSGHLLVTLMDRGEVRRIEAANPENSSVMSVGGTPMVIAADAEGQFAYAANMSSPGWLSVIDIASLTEVARVAIPGVAHSLAVSPRGDRVYVTDTTSSIFGVDVATRSIVSTTTVGAGPWGIVFFTTPSDSLLYVSARNDGSLSEVDMRTGSVVRTIPVGGRPRGVAIAPGGSTLYVADESDGGVLFVNRVTGAVERRVPAVGAFGIAISPDGNTLYVTTLHGHILVIDVSTATSVKHYEVFSGNARQIVVMPDGNTAMAADLVGAIHVVTR
jgi:YVTN family beta-propeller protein